MATVEQDARAVAVAGARSPSLCIRLLGELDVRVDGRSRPIPSARARSLLGYLIVHDNAAHTRQRLAFQLWPDSTEAQARTNLRNVFHVMRRACPELDGLIEATPTTLRWRGGRTCSVDVAAFRAALQRAEEAERGSDPAVSGLYDAVDVYSGDLLEDCYDEWATDERQRLRERYVAALRALTESLLTRDEHTEAIRLGRELIRRDPLDEDGYRLLMRVHDAAGDRAGAVRVYHECAATLRSELGLEPAAATRRAYVELTLAEDGDEHPSAPTTGAILVGRNTEWVALTRRWREAERGQPHLVLITGEAGVGKTRLAEELASWCAHRGAAVGRARSYQTEGELGYGVVISWLRTPDHAGQLRRLPSTDLAELARLLPELGAARAVPLGRGDDSDRLRLLGAITRALTASGRPLLLVVDDAHWSDRPSLQLMHYMLRQPVSNALLVVATARPDDLDAPHPLGEIVGGLQHIDRATELPLERLTRAGTVALARQLMDRDLDESTADALHAETEGNPLFVVETIRAGVDDVPGAGPISPKLQAVIAARFRQLSQPARRLLGVAATIGRAFTAALIARADDVDEVTLVQGLDELWRRGLIREHDGDAYDFSHGKIRDVAYDALSPAVRRRNHKRVAEALIALHPDDPEAVSGQVATNLDRAGQINDALAWYQRAARQAQRLSADVEAVRMLERARALVEQLPGRARRRDELSLLSTLATALGGADGFTSERHTAVRRRAVELATHLDVELDPPLLRSLVMASLCHNEFDEGRVAAERLVRAAERIDDDGLAVESRYLLGIASFWAADLGAARKHFGDVIDRYRPEQRAEHILRFGHDPQVVCLSRLANTLWLLGHASDAMAARDDALALARQIGHPFSAHVVKVFAAVLAVDLGDHDAVAGYAAGLRADRDRTWVFDVNAEAFAGYADVLAGSVAAGQSRIRAAMDSLGSPNPVPAARSTLTRVLVGAHELAGDPDAGLDAADEALAIDGTRLWEPEIRRLRAEFLAAGGGARADVAAELARAAVVAERHGANGQGRRIEQSRARLMTDS